MKVIPCVARVIRRYESAGHDIASNALMEYLVGTGIWRNRTFDVNVFGEYNIGGDYGLSSIRWRGSATHRQPVRR